MISEFNNPTWWERRQPIGSLFVICGYFVLAVILASVNVAVVLIRTAHQSSGENVVVWTRTVECVPVTCGRRRWARTAKIFIAWDTALIEELSWVWDVLFSAFSFPSYCPFWRGKLPLQNEYFVWRTVHCHRREIESIPHKVAQVMYRCGRRCRQGGYSIRSGMKLDGVWW